MLVSAYPQRSAGDDVRLLELQHEVEDVKATVGDVAYTMSIIRVDSLIADTGHTLQLSQHCNHWYID